MGTKVDHILGTNSDHIFCTTATFLPAGKRLAPSNDDLRAKSAYRPMRTFRSLELRSKPGTQKVHFLHGCGFSIEFYIRRRLGASCAGQGLILYWSKPAPIFCVQTTTTFWVLNMIRRQVASGAWPDRPAGRGPSCGWAQSGIKNLRTSGRPVRRVSSGPVCT